jgi:hypothetical protein
VRAGDHVSRGGELRDVRQDVTPRRDDAVVRPRPRARARPRHDRSRVGSLPRAPRAKSHRAPRDRSADGGRQAEALARRARPPSRRVHARGRPNPPPHLPRERGAEPPVLARGRVRRRRRVVAGAGGRRLRRVPRPRLRHPDLPPARDRGDAALVRQPAVRPRHAAAPGDGARVPSGARGGRRREATPGATPGGSGSRRFRVGVAILLAPFGHSPRPRRLAAPPRAGRATSCASSVPPGRTT